MISFGYWQRRFSGDATILGRQVSIHGVPFTIIGVTPPRFFGITIGSYPDITLPFATWERVAGRPGDFQNRYGYFRPWRIPRIAQSKLLPSGSLHVCRLCAKFIPKITRGGKQGRRITFRGEGTWPAREQTS
jgi:hypothetical protein